MSPGLVRLAILTYPGRWRRRYGPELQELTLMVLRGQSSVAGRALTLSSLAGHGLSERFLVKGSLAVRTAVSSGAAVLAAAFLMAGGLASDIGTERNVVLSPAVHLGVGVSVAPYGSHAPRALRRGQVVVEPPRTPAGAIVVRGASSVVVDPKSLQVVGVTRAGGA